MIQVKIDLDEAENRFVLVGDIQSLMAKPEIRLFLKSTLNARVEANAISIPYVEEEKERALGRLIKAFERYGIVAEKTDNIQNEMRAYLQEEENFKQFSKKALSIRNNQCNPEEFRDFTSVVERSFPNRSLYDLQLLSAYHLAFSQNACNFSVPGSGKTTILYAAYAYLKSLPKGDSKHVDKLLIIGPLNSFGPWEQEFEFCFGFKPNSRRLHGAVPREERRKVLGSLNPPEIVLLPYQGLPNLMDEVMTFLKNNRAMVVLDEAHRIKNVEGGIIANSALSIAKYAGARVVLTGTPMPNGYSDLMNQFKFIWPTKEIVGFRLFQLEEMTRNTEDDRIPHLIDHIMPYFIRIRKSDLELPLPVEHPPIIVEMGPIQRRIYDFIENSYLSRLASQVSNQPLMSDLLTRAKLIRLMQTATNPGLLLRPIEQFFDDQALPDDIIIGDIEIMHDITEYHSNEIPSKFLMTTSLVQDIMHSGEKVVIWTSFIQNILDLAEYLSEQNIQTKAIYGAIPVDIDDNESDVQTRESIIREFHSPDSNFKVLIANPHAVSESISLHKVCHNAIYLDRTFNAGHFIQSKDRIHRYGLKPTDVTNYYYLISPNSVDVVIHNRLLEKERRMNQVIEGAAIPLFNNVDNSDMADEDIRAIIRDYQTRKAG